MAATLKRPPLGVISEVAVAPDAKTQFKVNFRPMRVVPSMEHLQAIKSRIDGAQLVALEPYAETADEDDEPPAKAAAPAKGKKY